MNKFSNLEKMRSLLANFFEKMASVAVAVPFLWASVFSPSAHAQGADSWQVVTPAKVEKFSGMGMPLKGGMSAGKGGGPAPSRGMSPQSNRATGGTTSAGGGMSMTREQRCNIFLNTLLRRASSAQDLQGQMTQEQISLYHRLQDKIIAPCCWTQPVSLHPSNLSDAIKLDLQRRIVAGETEEQIIAAYADNCGERILSVPRFRDIYLIPIFASAIGIFIAGFLIFWWSRKKKKS